MTGTAAGCYCLWRRFEDWLRVEHSFDKDHNLAVNAAPDLIGPGSGSPSDSGMPQLGKASCLIEVGP